MACLLYNLQLSEYSEGEQPFVLLLANRLAMSIVEAKVLKLRYVGMKGMVICFGLCFLYLEEWEEDEKVLFIREDQS